MTTLRYKEIFVVWRSPTGSERKCGAQNLGLLETLYLVSGAALR